MSWSSDIRCLYCDGKLPLYRKITNGQFCSAPHRKLYWQEQERLGVERLLQTHDSLRATRPLGGVETILGAPPVEEQIPPPSGIVPPSPEALFDDARSLTDGDLYSFEAELQAPLWAPQETGQPEAPAPVADAVRLYLLPQAQWPADRLEAAEPNALPGTGTVRLPLRESAAATRNVLTAGIAKIPIEPRAYKAAPRAEPLHPVMMPCKELQWSAAPEGGALDAMETAEDIPCREQLLSLARFAMLEDRTPQVRREPWPAAPFLALSQAYLPLGRSETGTMLAQAMPLQAGLRQLSIDRVPLVHGTWIDSLRALGVETTQEAPRYELSTPALRPRLRLAAGSRYPVASRDAGFTVAVIEPENLPVAKTVSIPQRAMAAAAGISSTASPAGVPAPGAAGLLPLACAKPNEPTSPATAPNFNPPQPLCSQPMRPGSRLEPIDVKPVLEAIAHAPAAVPDRPVADMAFTDKAAADEPKKDEHKGGSAFVPPAKEENGASAWVHVRGFWKHAPRDLKLLVFGIPILLGLALNPALKKVPYTAPPQVGGIQRGIERNFQSKLNEQWKNVRQTMVDRAAIALDEDFRAGLDDWTSRGGTTEWAFDATGFVRPGPLALYRPSLDLTDYQLQFLGLIDKKALSWVVRAADFDDYYVVKLVVLKPGPVPTVGVIRYAVINGVAQDRADTIALINAREDMLYRVRMDIHGDVFALTIQGQLVDSWTEPRLRKGGVGFFTSHGEASRLRWVQVTHQYDMLGRLCAYLAPYNIPSTNGGWQP